MISQEKKREVTQALTTGPKDSGSPGVQAAIMTARITEIADHLKTHKKDHMARRGLLQLVGKRKKLLKYLAAQNGPEYLKVVEKLGLRK